MAARENARAGWRLARAGVIDRGAEVLARSPSGCATLRFVHRTDLSSAPLGHMQPHWPAGPRRRIGGCEAPVPSPATPAGMSEALAGCSPLALAWPGPVGAP